MPFCVTTLIEEPLRFAAAAAALILAIGWHEFSHVFVAFSLGDPTGRQAGRLTLNPLKHLDPIGTLLIFVGAFIGWGKPAPFNPANLRYRRYGSALVALGGPLSNLFLFTLASLVLRVLYPSLGPENMMVVFLQYLTLINVSLLLFNLLPLPPLDGSWLLLALFPRAVNIQTFYQRYGAFVLLTVIIIDFGLDIPIISPYLITGASWLISIIGIGPYLF